MGCSKTIPAGAAYPLDVVAIPSKAVWPYVQQWSLSVQQQLNRDTVATFAYVGSKGTHLTTVRQLNQFDPVSPEDNFFGLHEPIYYASSASDTGVCYQPAYPSGIPPFTTANGHRYWPGDSAYFNLEVACSANVNVNSFRKYPGYGRILSVENIANSSYNALQFTLHHVHGPLNLGINYTYGHSVDEASDRFESSLGNSLDPRSNRASSDFDQRHNLNISYVYRLPLLNWYASLWNVMHCTKGDEETNTDCAAPGAVVSYSGPSKLTAHILGGWELSGITLFQTGTPFSIINGGSSLVSVLDNAGVANGLGAGSYPDVVHGGNCTSAIETGVPGPLLGNPCNFVAPRGLTFGDAGRNYMNNPSRINFDAALRREFALAHERHLEVRAEAFNLFNHPQYRIYESRNGKYLQQHG